MAFSFHEFPDDLVLEDTCERCYGNGHVDGARCPACDGTGYELTEAGKKVLDLVSRRLGRRRVVPRSSSRSSS